MCRFLVYKGSDEILLSKLVLDPAHSILKQSFDSRLRLDTRRGQNNADGFGIGFYTDPKLGAAPCLFTSTTPAWNCANLQRLASKTASRLIFAHVRATTEGSLSEDNCHPFCHGSLMWMHNGGLGGWKQIKRRLGERLADKWYLGVVGGTDSEWAFALFLDTLERMGHDPSSQPENGFGPTVLRKAMLKTIAQINELIDNIPESVIHAENVDTRSLLNFAVSDGHSIICTRYVSSSTDEAASLYYSSGTLWETRAPTPGSQDYQMERSDKGADVVLVASEPLTFERENWVNVPTNSILTIHNQTVMVHPIIDRYYDRNPQHRRSTAFVCTKGLSANEKGTSRASTPLNLASTIPLPQSPEHHHPLLHEQPLKRFLGPNIPTQPHSLRSRSLSSEGVSSTSTLSTVLRARTPLAHAEPAPSNTAAPSAVGGAASPPSDARHLTAPPVIRSASSQQAVPAQGNIKKKRAGATLTALEAVNTLPYVDTSPVTPEPERTEFGNPNKIARMFPELALQ
ncbi:N-terminal nucleophile aminohydrolase [Canariomyces notabilis]|uniref:N-terminal nucleophile aminohydrolase n=1 Tax=Canariomyces notabilis TaxID=2074819 RepID=A0AAN6TFZ9_9PEZI|nr:N-terminal nucleophile aminohydrolase [Canariomyces arenarius]